MICGHRVKQVGLLWVLQIFPYTAIKEMALYVPVREAIGKLTRLVFK